MRDSAELARVVADAAAMAVEREAARAETLRRRLEAESESNEWGQQVRDAAAKMLAKMRPYDPAILARRQASLANGWAT